MKPITRSYFFILIGILIQWTLVPSFLFADPTTVTNTGNVPVRVQYKNGNSDYQDQTLKPGESKELPGGIEKVKVSRETSGEWASPLKPGQEVQVTVKEGSKPVGTLKGYGDKLIFDHPTAALPQTAIQIGSQPLPTQKTQEPSQKEPAKEQTAPKFEPVKNEKPEGTSKSEPAKPVEGKVTNDGNSTVVVRFKKTDGTTTEPEPVRSGNSVTMPEDASDVILSKPMIDSGYYWRDRKDVDVKITQPDGTTTAVENIPPAYTREGVDIKVTRPFDDLKIDYFPGSSFKLDPYRNMIKSDYQSGSSNQSNTRDMDSETGQGWQQRSQLNYKF